MAPQIFHLSSARWRTALVGVIGQLRRLVRQGPPKIIIDFSITKHLHPCGTLLFVSELDRLQREFAGVIRCNYPKDDVVEQLFQHIGLLQKLGRTPRKEITAGNVTPWHFESGHEIDASKFASMFEDYAGSLWQSDRRDLWVGMQEAMANCIEHAYTEERGDGLPSRKRWWMFAREESGMLSVALCDLGIGIQRSLPKNPEAAGFIQQIVNVVTGQRKTPEAKHIKAAIEYGKTRTKDRHRGKGLGQIFGFVERSPDSSLRIMSNKGIYTFAPERRTGEERVEHFADYNDSIEGTLIQWRIPLKAGDPI
ncbi:hypothetical protein HNQ50_000813 [Silvimonas terrae]|uniref:ATP-binding protein n=1 Tax=Silvimonas terrae TaxID=300266 RepID=A0A840RCJ0_9NEIS|nr:hypothetical protein [Silvimonas terrae]MBB5190103.1 hypothetical protein [Silvimonas terrae]